MSRATNVWFDFEDATCKINGFEDSTNRSSWFWRCNLLNKWFWGFYQIVVDCFEDATWRRSDEDSKWRFNGISMFTLSMFIIRFCMKYFKKKQWNDLNIGNWKNVVFIGPTWRTDFKKEHYFRKSFLCSFDLLLKMSVH